MYDVIYMGYSDNMVREVFHSEYFNLCMVVGVNGRTTAEEYEFIEQHHIPYMELFSAKDIEKINIPLDCDCILMYKFEYILPQTMVERHRIINFHGGDLRLNRGAHATVRSILNMDRETCLSMYELVGRGIDEGNLIDTYPVMIDRDDDVVSLNRKLARGIPAMLYSLNLYLQERKKATLVLGGIYYPKIQETDYTIDLDKDDIETICAKIRSQRAYKGAILIFNGEKYRITQYTLKFNQEDKELRTILDKKMLVIEGDTCLECPIFKEEFA